MIKLSFTHHLRRHCPELPEDALLIPAAQLSEVLQSAFQRYPGLQAYVLDERGRPRKHIALFIDGTLWRGGLDKPLSAGSEVHVMQALSGG